MAAGDVAKAARELQRRYGVLLAGEPSFRATSAQDLAVAAIEAARVRLRGEGVGRGQGTLFGRDERADAA